MKSLQKFLIKQHIKKDFEPGDICLSFDDILTKDGLYGTEWHYVIVKNKELYAIRDGVTDDLIGYYANKYFEHTYKFDVIIEFINSVFNQNKLRINDLDNTHIFINPSDRLIEKYRNLKWFFIEPLEDINK